MPLLVELSTFFSVSLKTVVRQNIYESLIILWGSFQLTMFIIRSKEHSEGMGDFPGGALQIILRGVLSPRPNTFVIMAVLFFFCMNNWFLYMQDITRWRKDIYVRVARISQCSCQWKTENPYLRGSVCSFYFIYIVLTAFLTIFRIFQITFRRFPKILQRLSKGLANVANISETFRKLPKTFEEDPKMIINPRIEVQFKRQT